MKLAHLLIAIGSAYGFVCFCRDLYHLYLDLFHIIRRLHR